MPQYDTIVTVALAGIVLSVIPGPSMLYVLSRSVGQSRAAGFASALSLGLGGVVLAVMTALGLAAVFAAFDWMVPALRYVGSAYLIWLGMRIIADARAGSKVALKVSEVRRTPFLTIVWQGMLVELLNPKTVLFFALFLPPFIEAGPGHGAPSDVRTQLLVLGILVPLTAVPSDLVLAWMGGTLSQKINRERHFREGLAWAGGVTLVLIALNLHLQII